MTFEHNELKLAPATTTTPGIVTNDNQTFSGNKHFIDTLYAPIVVSQTVEASRYVDANEVRAGKFIKSGGTSSQLLAAD